MSPLAITAKQGANYYLVCNRNKLLCLLYGPIVGAYLSRKTILCLVRRFYARNQLHAYLHDPLVVSRDGARKSARGAVKDTLSDQ